MVLVQQSSSSLEGRVGSDSPCSCLALDCQSPHLQPRLTSTWAQPLACSLSSYARLTAFPIPDRQRGCCRNQGNMHHQGHAAASPAGWATACGHLHQQQMHAASQAVSHIWFFSGSLTGQGVLWFQSARWAPPVPKCLTCRLGDNTWASALTGGYMDGGAWCCHCPGGSPCCSPCW